MTAPPAPPYIPASSHGGHQDELNRIVIHGTVSATERGGARAIAEYFQSPSAETSAHYVVDPGEVFQCVYDHTIAYHDGTNTNSLGVELCDPVDGPPQRWRDPAHQEMLRRASGLVSQLCEAYRIPKVKISAAQIRAGERGICGHADMRDAFPGSTTHYDPGEGFPWGQFLSLVTDGGAAVQVPGQNTTLKLGDRGPQVNWLQGQLNADLNARPGIAVTGRFDNATRGAVARYQRQQQLGLAGTRWLGIAGPKTIASLKRVRD